MSTVYWKDKNKEKEAGIGHLKKLHEVRRNNYISCSINWPFTNNNEICPKDIFAKTGSYLHTWLGRYLIPHFLITFFSITDFSLVFNTKQQNASQNDLPINKMPQNMTYHLAKCLKIWLTN